MDQILLDSVTSIPERELWWHNLAARGSVERSLQQAASREVHDLGSFAHYADIEIND